MSATSEFLHPERLWWLLAIPFAVLFVSAAGARKRPTAARLVSVLIRSAMLCLAVYALAGPVVSTRSVTPPRLDVVLDASRSVAPQARAQALDKVRTWAREQGLQVRVAAFGERARLLPDWGAAPDSAPASRPAAAGDAASDPNPAVALLRLTGRDDGGRAVVMFTDGLVAPPAEFVAAGAGRSALVVPAAAPGGGNVRLESIRAARDAAKPDETVLELGGSSSAGAHGVVRVLVDGREERSHPLDLPPGPFRTSVSAGPIPAGRHVVCAWLDGGDAEALDDELGVVVDVPEPATVMVVAPEGRSLVSSALKAQGIEHVVVSPPDVLQTPAVLDRAQVLVLDRMAVEPLSTPEILGRVSSLLVRGGGVLFIPRENPGELVGAPGRKFLDLLPFSGRPLEPKKKEEPKPEKPPPDEEGLKPPEPEKKKIERRPAPTLAILLVIDASGSMKGQALRLVKEAAIAAAEVLHPEDRVGVVAFNENPTQIVPMTKAGDIDDIREKISRLVAGGRTDFGPALDEAREIFRNEKVQIKHCIFLTDGHNNWPGAILSRVEKMAREGVTLSTVGAGYDVDVNQLSEMAAKGNGKFIPAHSAEAIPQVVTVEAERVVTNSGARRPFEIEAKADEPPTLPPPAPPKPDPPKPELPPEEAPRVATPIRAEWPAAYLKGIHPETTPGIFEWHRVDAAPHAWVSLATKTGDPVAIHTYAGFGRLVALTVPMQGEPPGPLVNWDDYANFTSQVVRFLTPATRPERLQLRAEAAGRVARLEVVDVEHKPGIDARLRFAFRDQRARPVAVAVRRAGPGAFDLEVPADAGAALVDVVATVEGEGGSGAASFAVGRPPEIERSGPDLEGLERWAGSLHGRVSATPPKAIEVAAGESVERRPAPSWWLAILLPLFLLDLALKRAVPRELHLTLELVIATGDPQGIGPEVSVGAVKRVLAEGLGAECVLVGDPGILARAGGPAGARILEVPLPAPLRDPPPSEAGGKAALAVLEAALARVLEDPARRALVTAPVSKAAARIGSPSFDGHTGWLAAKLGAKTPVMMFATPKFRVALVTVHVPLARVPALVTAERLEAVVHVVRSDLEGLFRIPDARIHVLGLNPHAGEAGGIGREEADVIAPAVEALRARGYRIAGPFPADSYFRPGFEQGCDAIIAWYHDQGLLPVKCLAFGEAVNVTLGLPIVRTSVDHGTAFDRAWRGDADPGSMTCALRLALDLLVTG